MDRAGRIRVKPVDFPEPPPPGSPEAIAAGCTCDPVANKHGVGDGGVFFAKSDCPAHGLEHLIEAIETGKAAIESAHEIPPVGTAKPRHVRRLPGRRTRRLR